MKFKTMYKIIVFLVLGVKARINPRGPTVVSDFVNCVNELVDTNFVKPGLIYVASTDDASTSVVGISTAILKIVHDKLKYSVKTSKPTNKDKPLCGVTQEREIYMNVHKEHFEPIPLTDYFITIVDKFKDFTLLVSRLTRSTSWNPKGLFIFVFFGITSSNDQNIKYVEDMLSCLFELNVINVAVIIPQVDDIRKANIYSWRPYDPPKYCGYRNESARQRLFVENVCHRGVVKYAKSIFEEKIPLDMKGCTLKVLALERQPFVSKHPQDPNIEKYFINAVAKQNNINLQYDILDSFRGEKEPTGLWNGALHDLESKRGHILLGGIFPDDEVHEDFEWSTAYLADSYTWVVPRALEKPLWLALFIIFQKTVWFSGAAAFLLISLSWNLLAKFSRDPTYRKNLDHYFINTWISNLGFVAFSRPVTQSLRIFFVILNIYCVLLLTAYQTKLIDVLTNPAFEHQMSTVEELVASGLKFGGSQELHDLFENSTDPIDNYFNDKWTDVENISNAMINVAVHRNFSLLCSRMELSYVSAIVPELTDQYGNSKFYAFQTNVFTVPIEMIALKGFPFMKKFSDTLVAYKQCGVNERIRRYFAGYMLRRKTKILKGLLFESSSTHALSVQTLQGGFLALLFGSTFGSVVLIVEIILNTRFIKSIRIFENSVYTPFLH